MKRPIPILFAVSALAGLVLVAATTHGAGQAPPTLPRALEAQGALVAQDPGNAAAWNDLGNLRALGRDVAGAEEAYRRAVELAPNNAAFHYNLALLLQEAGQLKEAATHYRRVLELDPSNAWAHFQLGVVNEERGQERRAIELYGEAFRLDPMLAFPDVNPHVIESDLITAAMLRGYRRGLVEPRAPRMYQNPGRITYMLVAPERQAPPPVAPPEAAAPEVGTAAPVPPGERRVLDQGDLGKGPVSQAAPQARGGYQPPGRADAGRSPSTVRSWRPPTPPEDGRGAEQDRRGGTALGGAVVGVPGGGGRQPSADGPPPTTRTVVPGGRTPRGVGSTGRLEMILEPADGADRRG